MSTRLRLNSWLLPILVVITAGLQIVDPARTWKTLLVVFGGAWLIGWLWARELARGLHLVREMRYGWAQVGDELEERFTILNDSFFPATWLELNDHSTLPDYHPSLATSVSARNLTEMTSNGECSRRGLFILGGTTLRSGDPLGIYTVTIQDPSSQTLLVLPPVVPLPAIEVTPGGFTGEGRPRSHSPEQTISAAGVREYQPGDSLHLIHWPSTARHDKPFVRLLDGTPSADWWIVLDLDSAVQVGLGPDSTEEQAVILAASLADRGLRSRKSVGLAVSGREVCWLPPRENERQRWEILRGLAISRPGELPLKQYLERSGKSFGRQASLVVVTSNVSTDWQEALAPLRWRGILPTVLLIDPRPFGGSGSAAALAEQLQHSGTACHIISRDMLDRPEAHPGQSGRWEWRISVTGKLIPVHKPLDADWRRLT